MATIIRTVETRPVRVPPLRTQARVRMRDPDDESRRHTQTDQDAAEEAFDDAEGALHPDLNDAEEASLELAEALGDEQRPVDRSRPMDFHIKAEGDCPSSNALRR